MTDAHQAYCATGEWFDLNIQERAILVEAAFHAAFTDDNGQHLLYHDKPCLHWALSWFKDDGYGPFGPWVRWAYTCSKDDDFGPGGEFCLGRDKYKDAIRPPLKFSDLWSELSQRKRDQLSSNNSEARKLLKTALADSLNQFDAAGGDRLVRRLARDPGDDLWALLSLERKEKLVQDCYEPCDQLMTALARTLSHFDGAAGERLVERLANAPDEAFMNYVELASSGHGLPKHPTREMDIFKEYDWDWRDDWYKGPFCSQGHGVQSWSHYFCDGSSRTFPACIDFEMPQYLPRPADAWGHQRNPEFREVIYDDADDELVHRIHNLPADLFLYLKDVFLQHVIGPRTVLLDIRKLSPHVLRSLDRETSLRVQRHFIASNTWVIPPGPLDYPRAVRLGANRIAMDVRKVVLSLSRKDVCDQCLEELEHWLDLDAFPHISFEAHDENVEEKYGWGCHKYADEESEWDCDEYAGEEYEWDILEVINRYDYQLRCIMEDMTDIWLRRFEYVSQRQLDHLVLDMTDTYGPCGTYEGINLAFQLPKLLYGQPHTFEVLAPTSQDAETIRQIITGEYWSTSEEWPVHSGW